MCGIFGILVKNKKSVSPRDLKSYSNTLFKLSESRGKEASGIALLSNKDIFVYKKAIRGSRLIKEKEYYRLFERINGAKPSPLAVIGHSRLATDGFQIDNNNNQPIANSNGVLIHNGIVVNDDELWEKVINKKLVGELDSIVLLELINKYYKKNPIEQAAQKTYSVIEGSASIAFFLLKEPYLVLATNTGSLYYLNKSKPKMFIFASESYILHKFLARHKYLLGEESIKVKNIKAGEGIKIHLNGLVTSQFKLGERKKMGRKKDKKKLFQITQVVDGQDKIDKDILAIYSIKNNLEKLKRHDFDYNAINKLRRCTRCILPETMPFIKFDRYGVCNFCKSHQKIRYKGVAALKELIEPFRSKNGKPDCILAFSGGRDSSYGLHFLKKRLKLNPIAYTYDWGMVTDLARRNEARMVGKLGVEHVIVSADITMKREHIRKHILAWMKKPELGMVPLFMEGDKQCEYYVDQLAKKTGIKLTFFTRGNLFENEEFKWGHCGIKNATPGGVIHNLSLAGKIKIAMYYGLNYLRNPAYINSSIFDTLFAYFSTYIQKHNYIFLWHYIPWREEEIIPTLKNEYNWETDSETKSTWRTDDGTSAFYNYIYYTGQGFTENDTFRSNQIREGVLSRDKALKLVNEENKPRHRALKWYFDRVGLDGDEVLEVVDNMPKLY